MRKYEYGPRKFSNSFQPRDITIRDFVQKKEIVMMMTARGEIAGEVHFFSFHS